MLIQLHHQFKDKTEMQAQKDVYSFDEMKAWFEEIKEFHPLPEGAIWMACSALSTITIDMDKKCSKCGKAGAIAENKAGLCLKCIEKILKNKWKKEDEIRRWK